MPTVYVIQAPEDAAFLRAQVLRHLPCNGYDYWLSRDHLHGASRDRSAVAMRRSQAILIVVSASLLKSSPLIQEIDAPLDGPQPFIVMGISVLGEGEKLRPPGRLWSMPEVAPTAEAPAEWGRVLVALLPPI